MLLFYPCDSVLLGLQHLSIFWLVPFSSSSSHICYHLFYCHSYADASGAGKDVYEYVSSSIELCSNLVSINWMFFLPLPLVWKHSHLFLLSFSSLCIFFSPNICWLAYSWLHFICLIFCQFSLTSLTMLFFIKLRLLVTILNFSAAIFDLMPFNFLSRLSLLENLRKQSGLTEFLLLIL